MRRIAMRDANSKRVLELKRFLFDYTDENNEFTIYELQEKLSEMTNQPRLDFRTIKQDIQTLNEMDFTIVENRKEFGKKYYSHQNRLFETYQVRLLIDAVLSAKFFTKTEKERLIRNLRKLTSKPTARTFPKAYIYNEIPYSEFKIIKYSLDDIHLALVKKFHLMFKYGSYNLDGEFELKREGEYYLIAPYALVRQKDQYYVIGDFLETGEIRHYRLDRMREIEVIKERYPKKEFDIEAYLKRSLNMFSGEETTIRVRFCKRAINSIVDHFGVEAIERDGDHHFILTAQVNRSEGLKAWLLKWGSCAELLEPYSLINEIKREIDALSNLYKK